MLQVGVSIGSNKNLKVLVKARFNTCSSSGYNCRNLAFSCFCRLLLSQWSVLIAWQSGSGLPIIRFLPFNYTVQRTFPRVTATELGTIALLANIFREMMALLGAPLIRKYFEN